MMRRWALPPQQPLMRSSGSVTAFQVPFFALAQDERSLLLATLAAWRDNGGSTEAIARQMFCHPNTVRLRLRRLESFTGRRLTDPLAAAEVLLALEAVQQSASAQIPPPV
jgi:DNA-binding PucR family transcriptional regulator